METARVRNHPGINKPRSSHVLSLVDKLTIKHLSTQTRNKPSLVIFIHFRILVLPCLWWLIWLNVVFNPDVWPIVVTRAVLKYHSLGV